MSGATTHTPPSVTDVEYDADAARLRSRLLVPAGRVRPGPGVVLFPEWWGVDDYAIARAQELALEGYTVLVADMYGDGQTTRDATVAAGLAATTRTGPSARARATAALDRLVAEPSVDPARVAALGFCFGGSVALELARSGARLAAAVALHASLATSEPAAPGAVRADILVLHGGDDPHVPMDQVVAFTDELRAAGVRWELVVYGGAQHSFSRPDAATAGIEGVAYHEHAARRAWATAREFLQRV